MEQCILRHPSARLTLLGTRIGAKAAKAVLMSVAAGRLTPEILSEALMSSSTVRGHVQREAMKVLVVRLSLRTPQQMQWLLRLVGDCLGGLSLTGAISSLTQRSLLYQVANFGLRGSAASAITTAAVQVGLTTCTLVTSNAAFWRKGDHKMSVRQYRYELLTSLYTGIGSVAGGAAGAAVGSLVMPGVGTAFGSVLCSVGAGYVPSYVRDKKGPDDRRRQQATSLRAYTPYRMHDMPDGAVLMYREELAAVTMATPSSAANAASVSDSPSDAAAVSEVERERERDEEDDGEPVWLDFVKAASPASVGLTAEEVSASARAAPSGSTSESSWDDTADDGAAAAEDGEATGLRSFMRFSPQPPSLSLPATSGGAAVVGPNAEQLAAPAAGDAARVLSTHSSFADLVDEDGGGAAAAETATKSLSDRFQGHAKYVTVSSEAELEAEVARFGGEDDLVLVFAEN